MAASTHSQLECRFRKTFTSEHQRSCSRYYYKIPVRKIYKQYPVYAPGREPAGYIDWLKKQEPVLLWDDAGKPQLKTKADWIKAGETVFSAPIFSEGGDNGVVALADIRSTDWYEKGGVPITKEGTVPFVHYVIRDKGKIELGSFSCAMCHTRVMSGGWTIKGAQGNFPFERAGKYSPRPQPPAPLLHLFIQALYGPPWLHPILPIPSRWEADTAMSNSTLWRSMFTRLSRLQIQTSSTAQ